MPSLDFHYVAFTEICLRLGAAAILSFLIGIDREALQKAFGLRTHMLLCIGTAVFVLVMMEMVHTLNDRQEMLQIDPIRIFEAVIAGIGFIGAGAIIRSGHDIRGATTGAGIWVVGGIGLACGLGLYWHAMIVTALVLLIIVALRPFDKWLERNATCNKNDEP